MGKYAPGSTTKDDILRASRRLFYEKGYRHTSFHDICEEAHVTRNTIYYYYKEKSALRHDVFQDDFDTYQRMAQAHCSDLGCTYLLAHYIQWHKFLHDPGVRRFMVEYFDDEPVYQEGSGLSRFYDVAFAGAYSSLISPGGVPPLSFASVYGYLSGMIHLINVKPTSYTADKIFSECLTTITKILDLNQAVTDRIWRTLVPCLRSLKASL